MSGTRPVCGDQPGPVIASPIKNIFSIIGGVSTGVGVLVGGWKIAHFAQAFTLWGAGAVGWGGVAGGLAAAAVVAYMWYNRCHKRSGGVRCWAGAVNHITPSFDSGWDVVFPSGALPPCVDVVLKAEYWPLAVQGAGKVDCSTVPANIGSPLIHSFFHSKKVCGAALGATIGAGVGVGVALALALAIGIGCSSVIFCALALLIAALVGAFIVMSGASLGGSIGRSLASSDTPTDTDGAAIAVGDLVTVNGKLLTMSEFDLTNCAWWVTTCAVHGAVQPPAPDYSDTDAAQLDTDGCPSSGTQVVI